MTLQAFLEMYDNWNGQTKVNNNNLEMITQMCTMDLYDNRKDLLDCMVVAFGFYDEIMTVRLAI